MAKALPVLGLNPDNTIQTNASLIIGVRIAELIAWERFIDDPERTLELHQMRIAAKRLRYTMETFAPFYGEVFIAAIEQIKKIQELLGSIHDADVLVPELAEYLQELLQPPKKKRKAKSVRCADFDAAAGLIQLCRHTRDTREALYHKFISVWRKLRGNGFFESLRKLLQEEAVQSRNDPPGAPDSPDATHVPAEGDHNGRSTSALSVELDAERPAGNRSAGDGRPS
ncbi:MAG TPA: CHAD domain-containing protein [Chthonomonadales bacterium]|nr:CHAD domain-containing protein [Chthonomonadales bacterium]